MRAALDASPLGEAVTLIERFRKAASMVYAAEYEATDWTDVPLGLLMSDADDFLAHVAAPGGE